MLRLVLEGLLELLWPPRTQCLLCQAPLEGNPPPACTTCWESMRFPAALFRCSNCSRPTTGGENICTECAAGSPFGRVYALGLHAGPLREAIHHIKFGGREDLAPPLGRKLAPLIAERPHLLVPVPLHRSRLHERGYNQATLIAQNIGAELSIPVHDRALIRRRSTGHQAKLDRAGRLKNLAGAFGLAGPGSAPWVGQRVLLVDDVLTTGATAAAVASVIRETGAHRVDLAVLAVSATPVHGNPKNHH